jgi:structural maintenance of chromosome 4
VKPDPDAAPVKKARDDAPANELYIYEAEELAGFKKEELVADEQLLDGNNMLRYSRHRLSNDTH